MRCSCGESTAPLSQSHACSLRSSISSTVVRRSRASGLSPRVRASMAWCSKVCTSGGLEAIGRGPLLEVDLPGMHAAFFGGQDGDDLADGFGQLAGAIDDHIIKL